MEKLRVTQFHNTEKIVSIQFHGTNNSFCYFHNISVVKSMAKILNLFPKGGKKCLF